MVRFRSSSAAVRDRGHGVGCERLHAQRHGWHAVDGGQDRAEIRERHERHGVRADIAARMYVIGNDASIGVAAERRADRGIAALEIADKGFAPRRAPAHRAAEPPGGPHNYDRLRMQIVARAEAAADIAGDDAHLVRLEHLAEHVLEQYRALAARDERVTIRAMEPDRRARLHLAVDDARNVEVVAHNAGRALKRALHGGRIAE